MGRGLEGLGVLLVRGIIGVEGWRGEEWLSRGGRREEVVGCKKGPRCGEAW